MAQINPDFELRQQMLELVNEAKRGSRDYNDDELEYGLPQPYTPQAGDEFEPNTVVTVKGVGPMLTGEAQLKYRRLDMQASTTLEPRTAFIWNMLREQPKEFRARLSRELGLCKLIAEDGTLAVDMQIPGGRIEQGQEALCKLVPAGGADNLLFTGEREIYIFAEHGYYDYVKYLDNSTLS